VRDHLCPLLAEGRELWMVEADHVVTRSPDLEPHPSPGGTRSPTASWAAVPAPRHRSAPPLSSRHRSPPSSSSGTSPASRRAPSTTPWAAGVDAGERTRAGGRRGRERWRPDAPAPAQPLATEAATIVSRGPRPPSPPARYTTLPKLAAPAKASAKGSRPSGRNLCVFGS